MLLSQARDAVILVIAVILEVGIPDEGIPESFLAILGERAGLRPLDTAPTLARMGLIRSDAAHVVYRGPRWAEYKDMLRRAWERRKNAPA